MATYAIKPEFPMTIKKVFSDMRFHFVLRFLVSFALVTSVVKTLRIDIRGKREPLAVGRPNRIAGAGRDRSDLFQRTARYIDRPDLILAVSSRNKCQFLA